MAERNLTDFALSEFLVALAERSPTPGGGSASAFVGAMAAALLLMFCKFTIGKKKYQDVEAEMRDVCAEAQSIMERLMKSVQQDAKLFNRVMEDRGDDLRYQRALRQAALGPYRVAECSLKILMMAQDCIVKGNQNLKSDIEVSIVLAKAAIAGALANVEINLQEITDEKFTANMRRKILSLTYA